MKVSVLCENTALDQRFEAEHGLSLFLETGAHRILFDMGQTDAFQKNAEKMNISLCSATHAILSHGHYDHGGGIPCFAKCNQSAAFYAEPHVFGDYYNASGKFIGLSPSVHQLLDGRLITNTGVLPVCETMALFTCNDIHRPYPTDTDGLTKVQNGQRLPDDFFHEQYLLIRENNRRILVSGCSHKGVLNLIHWFRPDVFIGGFHLMHTMPDTESGKASLEKAAHILLQSPTVYYTGHCTGEAQYVFLKSIMKERLHRLSSGKVFTI